MISHAQVSKDGRLNAENPQLLLGKKIAISEADEIIDELKMTLGTSNNGKYIRINAASLSERRALQSPWKKKGYRVSDKDGLTIWHEKEAIRQKSLSAFSDCDADLFLFGSQANNTAGKRSDYDIGYMADKLPSPSRLADLQEELEELPIPAHVELVNFNDVPEKFLQMVFEGKIEIWKKRSENSLFN